MTLFSGCRRLLYFQRALCLARTIDGRRVDKIMNGKELEANMYHDRSTNGVGEHKTKENGRYKVKGILSDNLRIEPLDINARSAAGPIPHKIIKIEQRARLIGNSTVDSKIKKNTNNFYCRAQNCGG
uniref:Putative secreted protein n=1 Tax=Ixodes ricinus TaxID=34613 RepID=V5GY96_IXORI